MIIANCHEYGSLGFVGGDDVKRATSPLPFSDDTSWRSYEPFSSTGDFSWLLVCGDDISCGP